MAKFQFQVSRKGEASVTCIAEVPSLEDLSSFKGGIIKVQTPKGVREVSLNSAQQMVVNAMAVELQNGVRNFLFPLDAKTTSNGSRRGYTS
jgi:hypothetical protein